MKVTFIVPSVGGYKHGGKSIKTWCMEPLEVAILAGLTPKGVDVGLYDDRIEQIDYETKTDLVAISVQTCNAKRAYEIAHNFKARGVPVVIGGFHATLMTEEVIKHCDSVVIGNAEPVWKQLIEDVKAKKLKRQYIHTGVFDFKGIFPDRSIFSEKRKKYLAIRLIETGRGCRFTCNFCPGTAFTKHTYNPRPIEDVVHEIQNCGSKYVLFVDDNIVCDRDRAKQLFSALIPLKIKWFGQATVEVAKEEGLLDLMKQSGCVGCLIGIESLNKKSLAEMQKWHNLQVDIDDVVRKIHNKGIRIYAAFVFGYDTDTPQLFEQTYRFALKHKFFLVGIHHLTPYPGTPVYARLKKEGRLLNDEWWLQDDSLMGDIMFHPKSMTRDELRTLCYKYRKKLYSLPGIAARFFNLRTNFRDFKLDLAYLIVNLLMRSDLRPRQHLAFTGSKVSRGDKVRR